jgi:hypothetical protein
LLLCCLFLAWFVGWSTVACKLLSPAGYSGRGFVVKVVILVVVACVKGICIRG